MFICPAASADRHMALQTHTHIHEVVTNERYFWPVSMTFLPDFKSHGMFLHTCEMSSGGCRGFVIVVTEFKRGEIILNKALFPASHQKNIQLVFNVKYYRGNHAGMFSLCYR